MSGKPAARQGDMTQYGGSIVQGSAGVRIGAPTGVACSVCPGGVTSGHPVNPLLGAKVLPGETDIALPAPLPFILSRLSLIPIRRCRPRLGLCPTGFA
ncbi:type IV secretion protein Rhs [Escherichia coli]|nr:type IV secretion protein Rhs [Escherichia coli]